MLVVVLFIINWAWAFVMKKNKWKFGAQVYDPNDITLKLYGTYEFRPNVYFIGQGVLPDHRIGSGVYLGLGYDY